jgi:hypothetical protein
MLVDDLHKVFDILKEIKNLDDDHSDYYSQDDDEKWKGFEQMLRRWSNMTASEKNRNFSEYTCYELHLFIKKHDPNFFDQVVKGFISSKMEKFFMDYFLIDDFTEVLKFATQDNQSKLNYFEKCLLIDVLIRSETALNKQIAEGLAHKMALEVSAKAKSSN